MYAKVNDTPDLVRDIASHGILSTNNDALSAYKNQRNKQIQLDLFIQEFNKMKRDIKILQDELSYLQINNMRF